MSSKKHKKFQKINIKPVHPIAPFSSVRKRMDLLERFNICLVDLFPPGIKLTANESKVLFILRAAAIGRSHIAAIDQEEIARISGIERPNVARAIAGLRRKGLIEQTWMETGLQRYRNIYEIWTPPEMQQKDAKAMRNRKRRADAIKRKADVLEKQAHPNAAKLQEQAKQALVNNCPMCLGEGTAMVYLPREGKEKARWCSCPTGHAKAEKAGCSPYTFIPDELLGKTPDNK